jgi:autoinducer-2 kinase
MSQSSRPLVLTIDAGSGSCRALVFDAQGKLLGLEQKEWTYEASEYAGGMDFDGGKGWEYVKEVVRGAIGKAGIPAEDIKAVSSTSMREGFVLFDKDGNEIFGVPNVDARAGKQAEALIAEGLAEPIYRRGGDWTSLGAAGRLRWVKETLPDVWERAHRIAMLGDWVLTRLSGEYVTDPSLGSSSGLFDLGERKWSDEAAQELGIGHLFPAVEESGTVVGAVTEQAARDTGLAAGTPVVTGGADTQLGLLGGQVLGNEHFAVVGGTFWLTAGLFDSPLVDPEIRLRTLCHVVPGQWMVEGVGFVHGLSTRFVRDGLYLVGRDGVSLDEAYRQLDALAAQVPPGANGVMYQGSNVMNARLWKHGPPSIVGVSPFDIEGTGMGAIFRAVLEEAAFVARGHLDILRDVHPKEIEVVSFVGGPSRSPLWSQVLADVLGVRVRVPSVEEATCLGAAMCAQVGAGTFASLEEAASGMTVPQKDYEPNPSAVEAYNEIFPSWIGVKDDLMATADSGNAAHMWKGAGA